ncbi:CbtA family protein [Acetobacteraceae bacterium KSS8]|uniref:CbtA family protein n=1 Tax=Endosaccharibacter trunci TaxID=2812733 RepID=A0ABT1W383_9PROT|nr:CbtA family protein [Acetobacteraceae bacterium KSS8]
MVRILLMRGMLVGFLAGLLVFGFARMAGEPQVDRAIAIETAIDDARASADLARGIHDAPEPEIVSRSMQRSWGLLTGVMVYSTAFGGLFALVFAFANGRVAIRDPRALSVLLAVAGFVAVALVPALKYPANPPSVGSPETIGSRTLLFAVMLFMSVAAMVGAVAIRRHLLPTRGEWFASLSGAGFYLSCVVVLAVLLPGVNEVPAGFPADLLWRFRLDSLGLQLILWSGLGIGFGALNERLAKRQFFSR